MNKTLVESVRCMLFEEKLPRSFQGEDFTCSCACYINHSPIIILNIEVPHKI